MGLRMWLWQRFTALYLLIYGLWLAKLVLSIGSWDFALWKQLWADRWVLALSFVAFGAVAVHATMGLWFIASDYLKAPRLRWLLLGSYTTALAVLFAALLTGGL